MATLQERIEIFVTEKGTRGVKKELDDLAVSGKNVSTGMNLAKAAMTGFLTAITFEKIIALADAGTRVRNVLTLATSSTEEFNFALNSVYDSAQRTGTSATVLAELYDTLNTAGKSYNISSKDTAQITDTIAKAFAAEGKSAAESGGAINALSKSLLKGKADVRGFISVLNESNLLAETVAQQFHLTAGQFVEALSQGKISSEQLMKALISSAGTIDLAFGSTQRTVGQAMASIGIALQRVVDTVEQSSHIFASFADTLYMVSNIVVELGPTLSALGVAFRILLSAAIVPFTTALEIGVRIMNVFGGATDATVERISKLNDQAIIMTQNAINAGASFVGLEEHATMAENGIHKVGGASTKAAEDLEKLRKGGHDAGTAMGDLGDNTNHALGTLDRFSSSADHAWGSLVRLASSGKASELGFRGISFSAGEAEPKIKAVSMAAIFASSSAVTAKGSYDALTGTFHQTAAAADQVTSSLLAQADAADRAAEAATAAARASRAAADAAASSYQAASNGVFNKMTGVKGSISLVESLTPEQDFTRGQVGSLSQQAYSKGLISKEALLKYQGLSSATSVGKYGGLMGLQGTGLDHGLTGIPVSALYDAFDHLGDIIKKNDQALEAAKGSPVIRNTTALTAATNAMGAMTSGMAALTGAVIQQQAIYDMLDLARQNVSPLYGPTIRENIGDYYTGLQTSGQIYTSPTPSVSQPHSSRSNSSLVQHNTVNVVANNPGEFRRSRSQLDQALQSASRKAARRAGVMS